MKVTVINGSPKGEYSITLQTVRYIAQKNKDCEFTEIHAGQNIRQIEKDFAGAKTSGDITVKEALEGADLLLFAYPVYTFLAPSQLHRFIELMKGSGIDVSGKFATQITTSKHFYDVTAHRYVQDNAQDMGLKFVKGLSADMDDLLSEKGQKEALSFFGYVIWCMENDVYESFPEKAPAFVPKAVTPLPESTEEKPGDVVIVADLSPEDTVLSAMIDRFRARFDRRTRVVNIREFPFGGGCISCFHCAPAGKCVYKDGFDEYLRNEIQTAEAIVYAFTVKDHSMGSRFKIYDDRQFCNGHRTVTMGMPFGYLVNGAPSREENLRLAIHGRAEVGGNFLAGIASSETDPDTEIDRLCARLSYAIAQKYVQPSNFLGVGGMKIFRDLIWLMQGMMRADHRFYRAHGQYDFPQKKRGTMLKMYLVGALMRSPKLMAKAGNKVKEGMIGPYKKVLEKEE